MKKYRKASALTSRGVYLRKRIAQNRRRAKLVGLLYLFATIALAAVACLPLVSYDLAPVGVMKFWKTFLPKNLDLKSTAGLIKVVTSGLYALMLLGVVINVLRALGKLGWLFKKRANRTHGFNRNAYAMEDLGNIFSGSLAVIVSTYLLIVLICGGGVASIKTAIDTALHGGSKWLIRIGAVAGVALVHILLGFWGAKVAYFDVEDGEVIEEKRLVGRFAPVFRNVLQILATCAIIYFFLQISTLDEAVQKALTKGGAKSLLKDMPTLVSLAAQAVILLCTLVLIKHASATTEYNIEGPRGPGMKNFRVFSFFIFLAAGAAVAYKYLVVSGKVLDKNLLIIAGIAFVMFLIELIMCKMPRIPGEKQKRVKKGDDEEIPLESLPQFKPQAQVAAIQPQAQAQAQSVVQK